MTRRRQDTHRTSDLGTVAFAREIRRNRTEAECVLWGRLRRKVLGGFWFRQQHPIGPYIADFYCDEVGLIVEVDNGVHGGADQVKRDRLRTLAMERHGLRVLRVSNRDVETDIEGVLTRIEAALVGR